MNVYDTRQHIIKSKNVSITQLKKYCSLDKMSRDMCSQKSFWIDYFIKKELKLPSYDITTPEEWFLEYEKEVLIKYKIRQLFKELKQTIVNFSTSFNHYLFTDLDVHIIKWWNKWLILKYKGLSECIPEPQARIVYDENLGQYQIEFEFQIDTINRETIVVDVTKQYLHHIFYYLLNNTATFYDVDNEIIII
jgi:hypothetical protein